MPTLSQLANRRYRPALSTPDPMMGQPATGGVKSPAGPFGPPTWTNPQVPSPPVNYGNGGYNYGGTGTPSWAIGDFGGGTYQGPGNAGSNNFGRGAINGQYMPRPQQNGQAGKAAAVDFRMGHQSPGAGSIADRDPAQWAAMQQKQAHNDAFSQWLQGQGLPMPGVGQGSDLLKQFYAQQPQWAPVSGPGNVGGY